MSTDVTTPDTIVLIHGFWVTPRSWEEWIEHYEGRGYRVLAPAYPGLEVEVEALREPEARAEIVRRREAFSADPAAFRAKWADAQSELAERVAAAEARLGSVRLEEDLYAAVGQVVVRSGVESHRADITIVECAKASAALAGRDSADADDVLAAAELALGHRLALDPFGPAPRVQPQVLRRLLEDALEAEVTPKKAAGGAR